MVLDQAANFVRGNLSSSVNSTQTTFPVNDASIYPDPANGEYNLVCWDFNTYARPDQDPNVEIVRVTGRDTTNDDLTVARAQEGTAGASHPSDSALQLSPTAKVFDDIESDINKPDWSEDANSPINQSGSQSHTISLNSSYDSVLVKIQSFTNTSGGFQTLGVQVNGQTSGYTIIKSDGTDATVAQWLPIDRTLGDGDAFTGDEFILSEGRLGLSAGTLTFGAVQLSNNVDKWVNGPSGPVSSITFRGDTGTVSIKARVYGWSGGL